MSLVDISPQKVFYSFLAVLVTQPLDSNEPADLKKENTIKRICKSDMNKPIQNDVSIEHYNGPKKTEMPEQLTMKHVLPLKGLAAMSISCTGAREMDTPFINNVIKTDNCPKLMVITPKATCNVVGQCFKVFVTMLPIRYAGGL